MHDTHRPVDIRPRRDLGVPALVLAVLSVPGSFLTWGNVPGEGWLWGLPPAIAAAMLAVAGPWPTGPARVRRVAALVVAGAMLVMMILWGTVESIQTLR